MPLPTTAAHRIDRWLEIHPGGGQLLRGVDRWGNVGDGLSSAAIPNILWQLCRRSGLAPISAHAFRARRITQVIPAADPLVAQRFAGHSSSAITAIYDRRGAAALAVVVDSLETAQSERESAQLSQIVKWILLEQPATVHTPIGYILARLASYWHTFKGRLSRDPKSVPKDDPVVSPIVSDTIARLADHLSITMRHDWMH